MPENIKIPADNMRLDKWLWCARFYKTRGLAADAINSGKVSVDNIRTKRAKLIHAGDQISIRRTPYRFDITVLALASARRSAVLAALLYEESRESISTREKLAVQLKADMAIFPRSKGRPTKRSRRELIRFKSKQ